jgi:hypothetical protein
VVWISKFCDLHGLRCIKWLLILVLFSLALGEGLIFGQKVSVLSNRLAKPYFRDAAGGFGDYKDFAPTELV